jgi:HEAT repeat protein
MRVRLTALVIWALLMIQAFAQSCGAQDLGVNAKIVSAIFDISNESSISKRVEFAHCLVTLVRDNERSVREEIATDTIDRLSRLLDDRSDAVRFEIALGLGFCGPAATRAVPQLLVALKEAQFGGSVNRSASSTSADAIAATLEELKVCVPTPGPDLRGRCDYLLRASR